MTNPDGAKAGSSVWLYLTDSDWGSHPVSYQQWMSLILSVCWWGSHLFWENMNLLHVTMSGRWKEAAEDHMSNGVYALHRATMELQWQALQEHRELGIWKPPTFAMTAVLPLCSPSSLTYQDKDQDQASIQHFGQASLLLHDQQSQCHNICSICKHIIYRLLWCCIIFILLL